MPEFVRCPPRPPGGKINTFSSSIGINWHFLTLKQENQVRKVKQYRLACLWASGFPGRASVVRTHDTSRVAHSSPLALHWIPRPIREGYMRREEQRYIKKPSVAQWLAGARPLSPHGEDAMFDSRHGGLSPPRLGSVEFLFFRPACFCFVALGGFSLMMAISRTSPCLIFSFASVWVRGISAASSTLLDVL